MPSLYYFCNAHIRAYSPSLPAPTSSLYCFRDGPHHLPRRNSAQFCASPVWMKESTHRPSGRLCLGSRSTSVSRTLVSMRSAGSSVRMFFLPRIRPTRTTRPQNFRAPPGNRDHHRAGSRVMLGIDFAGFLSPDLPLPALRYLQNLESLTDPGGIPLSPLEAGRK